MQSRLPLHFVGQDAHDAGLGILDDGFGLARLDAGSVLAVLAGHDPARFGKLGIDAFFFGFHAQVVRYFPRHAVLVVNEAVAVAAGHHAGFAADAAVHVYGEA